MSQEIYVKEMPKSCMYCSFAYDGRCQAMERKESYCVENCKRSDCPLIDVKTHDRELVKEVCEKIRKWLRNNLMVIGGKAIGTDIEYADGYNDCQNEIKELLNQIQNEVEDEQD